MGSERIFLFFALTLSILGSVSSQAALGGNCSNGNGCADSTNHVCDPATNLCKVKADGTATNCSSTDSNCPKYATCSATSTTTCSCETGYIEYNGLCSVIGSTCASDSDCSTALTDSVCQIVSPCSKGICVCSDGYSGYDCLTLGYEKNCDTGTDKCDSSAGLVCDGTSTKCACSTSGHTYKSDVRACTDKKLFGETCSAVAECYINRYGACTDSKCGCVSGFVKETSLPGNSIQTCRPPFADEMGCNSTCQRFPSRIWMLQLPDNESSQMTPTCTSNKCGCAASGESIHSSKFGSLCINYCLTDLASGITEKGTGVACTELNECESKFCAKCPGDANAKCYEATCTTTSNGVKIANGIVVWFSIILLSYLY